MRIRELRGSNALFIARVQASEANIVHDRSGEELYVLENNAQRATQIRLVNLGDIDSVKADFAIGNIVETVDQVGDGRLTRTRRTNEGNLLTGSCPQ